MIAAHFRDTFGGIVPPRGYGPLPPPVPTPQAVCSALRCVVIVVVAVIAFVKCGVWWLTILFGFDSTDVRRAFDCLSTVIKVTVT